MVNATPRGYFRPGPDSWLARFLERRRRSDAEFDCAVRVIAGTIDGEGPRFVYRRSAVDRLRQDGAVTLTHGTVKLRIRVLSSQWRPGGPNLRLGHGVWVADVIGRPGPPAVVELAASPDQAVLHGLVE